MEASQILHQCSDFLVPGREKLGEIPLVALLVRITEDGPEWIFLAQDIPVSL
jgi:hypothetical protein